MLASLLPFLLLLFRYNSHLQPRIPPMSVKIMPSLKRGFGNIPLDDLRGMADSDFEKWRSVEDERVGGGGKGVVQNVPSYAQVFLLHY